MNPLHLQQAIATCKRGGIIAYPTEAVFGLGCLPLEEKSVYRILDIKQRPVGKGLILIASDIEQLDGFVSFDGLSTLEQIQNSWPGPYTWLIPALEKTPPWLTGEHSTLAVRVSAHPVVNALCKELGPIVSTSANPAGEEPALSDGQVCSYFGENVDYVMSATITNDKNPTEIRDGRTGELIRAS